MMHKELLTEVEKIAREAGKIIMQIYARDFEVMMKVDKSPVTEADLAANDYIEHALKKLTPDIPILSEESEQLSFSERSQWDRYWLIDPLDGTRAFVRKSDEFTVNIALVSQHQPILGVVYIPVTEESYFAAQDEGAFKLGSDGKIMRIACRELVFPPAIIGNKSKTGEMQRFLKKVGDYEFSQMSSSWKVCLVAEGSVDLYTRFFPTSEWDTAASHAVINEAGGQLVTTDMQPLLYNTKESLENPHFFVMGKNHKDWSLYLEST